MSGKTPSYRLVQLFIVTLISTVLFGCGGSDSPQEDTFVLIQSDHNTQLSHNQGKNCLNSGCHGGINAGPKYTLAGTVFTSASGIYDASNLQNIIDDTYSNNAYIKIFHDGMELMTIPIDKNGNFYTNAPIPSSSWDQTLFVQLISPDGSPTMGAALASELTGGDCNNCHIAGVYPGSINYTAPL